MCWNLVRGCFCCWVIWASYSLILLSSVLTVAMFWMLLCLCWSLLFLSGNLATLPFSASSSLSSSSSSSSDSQWRTSYPHLLYFSLNFPGTLQLLWQPPQYSEVASRTQLVALLCGLTTHQGNGVEGPLAWWHEVDLSDLCQKVSLVLQHSLQQTRSLFGFSYWIVPDMSWRFPHA